MVLMSELSRAEAEVRKESEGPRLLRENQQLVELNNALRESNTALKNERGLLLEKVREPSLQSAAVQTQETFPGFVVSHQFGPPQFSMYTDPHIW